jgi:dolichol-phosphate mannosyltransferase
MLSILIPLRDEFDNLDNIVGKFDQNLQSINYEVIFVNDFSSDNTLQKAKTISSKKKNYKVYDNQKKGLGGALNLGIEKTQGEYTCIMMADLSDDIDDLKVYYKKISQNEHDAIFGSRFMRSSKVKDYPLNKLILNRIFNFFVKVLFLNKYNDFTNAFKIYRSDILKSFIPLISESFNIFLEMPLKIISRGYKYEIIPINWYNRKKGKAKFNIKELRSKYLFTLIYCFIEKILLNKKNKSAN